MTAAAPRSGVARRLFVFLALGRAREPGPTTAGEEKRWTSQRSTRSLRSS